MFHAKAYIYRIAGNFRIIDHLGYKIKFCKANLYACACSSRMHSMHAAWPCPITSNATYLTKYGIDGIFLGSGRPIDGLEKYLYRAIDDLLAPAHC